LRGVDYSHPLTRYRGSRVLRVLRSLVGDNATLIDETTAIDVYYALYLPAPILEDGVKSPGTLLVNAVLNTPSGVKLRTITLLDSFMSTIASAVVLSKFLEGSSLTIGSDIESDLESINLAKHAVSKAYEEVVQALDLKSALEGQMPGSLSVESIEEVAPELLRLARDIDVRELLEVVKSLEPLGFSPTRREHRSKRGVRRGYEIGLDFERVVPRDVLIDSDLFLYKLVQGKLLLYEKYVEEYSGPVYMLVDKSGSMEGEKIKWAKALALAVYTKCVKSKRAFYIRFFNSQPHQLRGIDERPSYLDAIKLFEYIAKVKNAGGTDITRALMTALRDLERLKRSPTLVLVTDGIDRIVERPLEEALARTGVELLVVMIKGDNESLRALANHYFKVIKLEDREILRVVRLV
jgi:uncharacterized protein with von Willebrand factor type A (vWA) domain